LMMQNSASGLYVESQTPGGSPNTPHEELRP